MTDDDEVGHIDGPDQTSVDRWEGYKQACRERGYEPLPWGRWLKLGEPSVPFASDYE